MRQRKKSYSEKRKSLKIPQIQIKTIVNQFVVLKASSNHNSVSEYIIIVSKKIGSAVVRNKIKRRLKNIIKKIPLKTNYKLIFITKKTIVNAKFEHLNCSIIQSISKL